MFENNVIHGILTDPSVLEKLKAGLVQPHHFDTYFGKVCYEHALSLNDQGFEVTPEALKDVVSKSSLRSDDKANIVSSIDIMVSGTPTNVNYSIKEIVEKRKEADFKAGVREAVISQREEELDKAIEKLQDTVRLLNVSDVEYEIRDYRSSEDVEKRIAERKRLVESTGESLRMTGGLSCFEPYFPFGIGKETMTAVCAGTGVGKSILLGNFITEAINEEHCFNVLYVITENRYVEATTRLDAMLLEIDYQELYKIEEIEQSRLLAERMGSVGGNLFVVKVPTDEININHVKMMLDKKKREGFPIDCLFIDSPEHFLPTRKREREYLNKAQVYWDLKHLNDLERLIIFTTVQEKAGASDNETSRSEDTSGSVEIPRILDHQFFMKMSKEDEAVARRWIFLTKNRGGLLDGKRYPFRIRGDIKLEPFDSLTGNKDADTFKIPGFDGDDDFDAVFNVSLPNET